MLRWRAGRQTEREAGQGHTQVMVECSKCCSLCSYCDDVSSEPLPISCSYQPSVKCILPWNIHMYIRGGVTSTQYRENLRRTACFCHTRNADIYLFSTPLAYRDIVWWLNLGHGCAGWRQIRTAQIGGYLQHHATVRRLSSTTSDRTPHDRIPSSDADGLRETSFTTFLFGRKYPVFPFNAGVTMRQWNNSKGQVSYISNCFSVSWHSTIPIHCINKAYSIPATVNFTFLLQSERATTVPPVPTRSSAESNGDFRRDLTYSVPSEAAH